MLDIALKRIYPQAVKYASFLAESIKNVKDVLPSSVTEPTQELLSRVLDLSNSLYKECSILDVTIKEALSLSGSEQSHYYYSQVIPRMKEVRKYADDLELIVSKEYWPLPTYSDILFYN